MNRKQVLKLLKQGKNLYHPFFNGEAKYIFQKKGETSRIYFDDGSYMNYDKFWEFKKTENWDKNWEIIN